MPGAMRKMGVYLGLVEDDEEAANDAAPLYERVHGRGEYQDARYSRGGDATHLVPRDYQDDEPGYGSEYADAEYPGYRITTLHPRTYNEARTIGEHFRNGTPVIMNLSEMNDADAKRLVDFAAGLIFGLHGSLERVTAKVFLLSPHNITVTAADKARIAEGGFFNQS